MVKPDIDKVVSPAFVSSSEKFSIDLNVCRIKKNHKYEKNIEKNLSSGKALVVPSAPKGSCFGVTILLYELLRPVSIPRLHLEHITRMTAEIKQLWRC